MSSLLSGAELLGGREEQGPYHAKARVETHAIAQELGATPGCPPERRTAKDLDVTVSKQTVNALHQMVLGLMGLPPVHKRIQPVGRSDSVATDLESFATHAKRKTVAVDDVMLLTRRNDSLVLTCFGLRCADRYLCGQRTHLEEVWPEDISSTAELSAGCRSEGNQLRVGRRSGRRLP